MRSLSRDITKEENFAEALRESHRAYASEAVGDDTASLLAGQRGRPLQAHASQFSFMLRALQLFLDAHGMPPLVGALPDMTSTTGMYTELQQAYREQAQADRRAFSALLQTVMRDAGCTSATVDAAAFQSAHEETVDLFCRNCAHNLRVVSTRSVAEERQALRTGALEEAVEDAYEDAAQTPIGFYMALRGAETFFSRYQRAAGSSVSTDVNSTLLLIIRSYLFKYHMFSYLLFNSTRRM